MIFSCNEKGKTNVCQVSWIKSDENSIVSVFISIGIWLDLKTNAKCSIRQYSNRFIYFSSKTERSLFVLIRSLFITRLFTYIYINFHYFHPILTPSIMTFLFSIARSTSWVRWYNLKFNENDIHPHFHSRSDCLIIIQND